mgnify:CR=1 FL=1
MPKLEVTHPDKTTITFEMCPYEDQVIKGRSIRSFRQGDVIAKCLFISDRPMGPYTVMLDHGIAKLVAINSNLIMDKVIDFDTTSDWYLFSDFDSQGKLKTVPRPQKQIINLELGEYFEYDGNILYRVDDSNKYVRALSTGPLLKSIPNEYQAVTPLGILHINSSEQIGRSR